MKIFIKAKPGAKRVGVIEETNLFGKKGERHFTVAVAERAVGGAANRAIEAALAKHLGVAPSRVQIISGLTTRKKIVEIR